MARHLTTTAETGWEFEAATHLIELNKGDSNGAVFPEESIGMSYEDLPTLKGRVSGPNASMAKHFNDTGVSWQESHIDWDYVEGDDRSWPSLPEVRRTEAGLALRDE